MSQVALTQHARTRCQQRGVPHHLISALVAHADVEAPVGGGCTVLRISRERLCGTDLRASLGADADQLGNLALVWSDRRGEVVTVLRDRGGRAGRRYRRGH